MEIVLELVVKDIFEASNFYKKYLGFELEFTENEPITWMQLKNGNTILMLVTEEFAKEDIPNLKDYTPSTNLYKFRYESLDEIKEIYEQLKKDQKEIFLEFRKSSFRYEFGVYDNDGNMLLITYVTND